ncbi:MAG: winged helix-turn-helix transcriptional regulator [Promethearchaeota archaeon]
MKRKVLSIIVICAPLLNFLLLAGSAASQFPGPPSGYYDFRENMGRGQGNQRTFGENFTVAWWLGGGGDIKISSSPSLKNRNFSLEVQDTRPVYVDITLDTGDPDHGLEKGSRVKGQKANTFSVQESFVFQVAFNITNSTPGSFSFSLSYSGEIPPGYTWARYDENSGTVTIVETEQAGDEMLVASTTLEGGIYLIVEEETPNTRVPLWFFAVIVLLVILGTSLVLSKKEYRDLVKRRFFGKRVPVHRLSIEDVLENENRSKIIDLVLDNPGIHFNKLRELTGLTPGVLTWHLDILNSYGVIRKEIVGQYLLLFPAVGENPLDIESITLFKSETALQVIQLVRSFPGLSQNEISRKIGKDPKTVMYHLDKLENEKFVVVRREGRKKVIFPGENSFSPHIRMGG